MDIGKCMNISAMCRTTLLELRILQTANKKGKLCGRGFGLEELGEGMTGMSRKTNLACGDMEEEGML